MVAFSTSRRFHLHCRWEILLVYIRSLAVGPLPAPIMTGKDTAGNVLFSIHVLQKGSVMWDDVVVGDEETQKRKGGSARGVKIAEPVPAKFSISENAREFWISGVFLGLGMTVGKNTSLGERLIEEIAAESSGVYIVKMLQKEFIPLVNPARLVAAVNSAIERAHDAGRREKAIEIHRVLCSD